MNAGRPRARIESASRSAFSSLTNAPIWTRHTGSVCSTPRFSMRRSAPLVTGTVYCNRRPCSAASRPSPSRLLASARVIGPDGRNESARGSCRSGGSATRTMAMAPRVRSGKSAVSSYGSGHDCSPLASDAYPSALTASTTASARRIGSEGRKLGVRGSNPNAAAASMKGNNGCAGGTSPNVTSRPGRSGSPDERTSHLMNSPRVICSSG